MSCIRERRKAPTASKSTAQRWAESRERVLLVHGKPDRTKEAQQTTMLREFAPRFVEGHAKANRLKASGIASKECVRRIHLVPALRVKPLATITTEDVPATQIRAQREVTEDAQQHFDGAECADAEREGV